MSTNTNEKLHIHASKMTGFNAGNNCITYADTGKRIVESSSLMNLNEVNVMFGHHLSVHKNERIENIRTTAFRI